MGHHVPIVNHDRFGFLQWHPLPASGWDEFWDRIYVDQGTKDRLERFARLMLFDRERLGGIGLPISNVGLIAGPPGTGKTSLVRGLADRLARQLAEQDRRLVFAEVDGHALPSQMLGESQRNVAHLLERSIPELAENADAVVVLIDEVDGFAVNRADAAAGADPVDVVRATEAALRGIDRLAAMELPVVVFGTTNFSGMLDEAFVDRIDLVEYLGLPDAETIARILGDSLSSLSPTGQRAAGLAEISDALVGFSAREVRRLVFLAMLHSDDPGGVPSHDELLATVKRLRGQRTDG